MLSVASTVLAAPRAALPRTCAALIHSHRPMRAAPWKPRITLRGFGVSEGRSICHQPLCPPDNNRTQYFIKIKCPEHAQRLAV